MFSSTNSPFPQYYFPSSSSSSYPPPPPPLPPPPHPIVNQDQNSCIDNNIFLHQNHHFDQISFLLSHNSNNNNNIIPQILIPETLINLGVSNSTTTNTTPSMMTNKAHEDHITSGSTLNLHGLGPNFVPRKPSKKDRHSKIYTAQGLRDRRVRLSIEIAREFFDLHDMLGFDKASKTLEWLLTKSKKAIKEVSRTKLNYRSTKISLSSTTSECEEAVVSEVNEAVDRMNVGNENLGGGDEEEARLVSKNELEKLMSNGAMATKESRAKARARARERTREKRYYNNNCTRRSTSGTTITTPPPPPCLNSQISNQFRSPNFISQTGPSLGLDDHQESHHVMIKRSKLKLFPGSISSSTTYNHDHQKEHLCGISKGESSNIVYSPSTLLPPNWDTNGSTRTVSGRPGLRT